MDRSARPLEALDFGDHRREYARGHRKECIPPQAPGAQSLLLCTDPSHFSPVLRLTAGLQLQEIDLKPLYELSELQLAH